MIDIKKILLERITLFNDEFSQQLSESGYVETSIIIDRLQNTELMFPSSPEIRSVWRSTNRTFTYRITQDYFTDFEFKNLTNGETMSIQQFKRSEGISEIEIYKMKGETTDEKLKNHIISTSNLIKTSELLSVLDGSNWITFPFDWQERK